MTRFISRFSAELDAMFAYREALGFSKDTHVAALMNFDRFIASRYPEAQSLSRDMVHDWIGTQMEKPRGGVPQKATAIRLFGKYLSAIGKEAYILPEEYVSKPKTFTPYIFTDEELTRLFRATDCLPENPAEPLASKIAPVLFRLVYTCGLRPNEGRELRREHIDFQSGEIFITKTKRKKERAVVMSDDMLALCKKYDAVRSVLAGNGEYFFPRRDGQVYTDRQLDRLFKKCWADANPTIPAGNLPSVRIYDLRHRFASAVLNKWLDDGQNLYNKLPYLRAYMGHEAMSETAYYIHILPENIVKSAGIDWAAFEALIPGVREEVGVWRE